VMCCFSFDVQCLMVGAGRAWVWALWTTTDVWDQAIVWRLGDRDTKAHRRHNSEGVVLKRGEDGGGKWRNGEMEIAEK
jgi:hypothetical protein